jgi:hypothetical protein
MANKEFKRKNHFGFSVSPVSPAPNAFTIFSRRKCHAFIANSLFFPRDLPSTLITEDTEFRLYLKHDAVAGNRLYGTHVVVR